MNANDAEYQHVFIDLSATYFNKQRTTSYFGTYSCRASLLFYIIIYITWDLRTTQSSKYIDHLVAIVNACYRNSSISRFISENFPYSIDHVSIENGMTTTILNSEAPSSTIYPMGLVNISDGNPRKHVINHFFAIVRLGSDFFIVSSYGCDTAYARQSMIAVDKVQFNSFIVALNSNNFEGFSPFMAEYFFPREQLKPKAYVRDKDTFSRPKEISFTPDVGVHAELEFYKEGDYKCFYFPSFVQEVRRVISESELESKAGGGRKKKSRKKRAERVEGKRVKRVSNEVIINIINNINAI